MGSAGTGRRTISKRVRFEVFKRDSFKCQYCGKAAPDVLLHVDHIEPVSKGGSNDLLNLITACADCNTGKGARALSDDSAVAKQKKQLAELAERREQLEMMIAWRKGLNDLDDAALGHAVDAFNSLTDGQICVNETGRMTLRRLIHKHGLQDVLEAISAAGAQYLQCDADGRFDNESAGIAFSKVGSICRGKNLSEDERQLFYIRGICRNRFDRCVDWQCIKLLKAAYEEGASIGYLKQLALDTERWSTWRRWMNEVITEYRADRDFPGWRADMQIAISRAKVLALAPSAGESLGSFVGRIDNRVSELSSY